MLGHLLRKLAAAPLLVWFVVTLIFVLLELSPGSVADHFVGPDTPPELRAVLVAKYHLDDPAPVRYLALLRNLAVFDFGRSIAQGRPVVDIVRQALPNTLLLASVSLLVAWSTGLAVGTWQAVRHGRAADAAVSAVALVLHAMPEFWFALLLQLVAVHHVPLALEALGASPGLVASLTLPLSGMTDPVMFDYLTPREQLVDRARHLILPGVAMGLAAAGGTARFVRAAMLDVLRQDFVRTARAKGLPERVVILRHALRNALLPVITLIGLTLPALFSGAVVIERIFAWPGMGRVIVDAIFAQDTPVLMACFYVFTLLVVAGNLLADLGCALADPRIRLGS